MFSYFNIFLLQAVLMKILTLNCSGLNKQLKIKLLFKYFKNYDIICLQETYVTDSKAVEWMQDWNGEFYYHAFTNKSQGQIILINKTFCVENVKFNPFSTRCIEIRFDKQGKTYNILNYYGPAIQQQRQMFLEELTDIINKVDQNNLIVCGDFNMVLHNVKDIISGAAHGHNEVDTFNNLLQVMDLNDCWIEMNKETKAFTWSRKEPFVTRRLD